MRQFIAFVKKEFYHIFRDRRTMLILLGMPVVQINENKISYNEIGISYNEIEISYNENKSSYSGILCYT